MTSSTKDFTLQPHTPGPWEYDMDYIVAPDPNGVFPDIYIAEIAHADEEGRVASPEQQDANRRLIAAAPELHDAAHAPDVDAAHLVLEELLDDPNVGNDDIRDAAIDLCSVLVRHREARTSALAKSQGRQP